MIANSPSYRARRALSSTLAVVFASASAFASSPCRADGTSSNAAVAETLFREGKELIRAGKVAEGCARLAESQRLDPGGGTLLALATCHEQDGRTATAYLEFKEAAAVARQAGRSDRADLAQQRVRALEPKLSTLTVAVPAAAQLADLGIDVDGAPLVRAAWGSAVPTDPGKHVVEAHATGYSPWRADVDVGANADRRTVTLVPLARGTATAASVGAPSSSTSPPTVDAAPPQPVASTSAVATGSGASPSSARRTVAYVTGGAGIVALGVATFFGVKALSASSDAKADGHCDATGCDAAGVAYVNDAHSAARISNITGAVGLVAVGTSLVLLLTNVGRSAPPSQAAVPRVQFDVSGITGIRGRGFMSVAGTF